jgi:hypothetical protein
MPWIFFSLDWKLDDDIASTLQEAPFFSGYTAWDVNGLV